MESKRRQLEDDRRQLQHLKVLSGRPGRGPGPHLGGGRASGTRASAGWGEAGPQDPGLGWWGGGRAQDLGLAPDRGWGSGKAELTGP